jgi:hypothetical protein
MSAPAPKVLLMTLWERTSARGTRYLSGFLGKAKLIGFKGEPTADGTPTWNLFVQEQEPKAEAERKPSPRPAKPQQPERQPDDPFYSDAIDDIGRGDP